MCPPFSVSNHVQHDSAAPKCRSHGLIIKNELRTRWTLATSETTVSKMLFEFTLTYTSVHAAEVLLLASSRSCHSLVTIKHISRGTWPPLLCVGVSPSSGFWPLFSLSLYPPFELSSFEKKRWIFDPFGRSRFSLVPPRGPPWERGEGRCEGEEDGTAVASGSLRAGKIGRPIDRGVLIHVYGR